jgi:S-adenosylmethionine:tRNA ribosyltransferase-isomerase
MFDPGAIRITDYNYPLPADLIAQFPLENRDASKLLVCDRGIITGDVFSNIAHHLPAKSLLVFNDTRVIRARLLFTKSTGATIEIFCLEPMAPSTEIEAAFHQQSRSTWKCLVGNLKRWKGVPLVLECTYQGIRHRLFAEYVADSGDGSHAVEFHWDPPEKSFSEILELSGLVPLPPYIHRQTELLDTERYQTIYAVNEGSVAAPTAGLHFTDSVFRKLSSKDILTEKVTLHVGVGTFKPVSAKMITDHVMHHEKIVVSEKTISRLLHNRHRPVFAVGTTSARTLESLYWLGVKLIRNGMDEHPAVLQWDPYQEANLKEVETEQALEALLRYLQTRGLQEYAGETQLLIVPGYRFRMLSGLITNFHMPQSTLLLLVAALVGEDWKLAYDFALSHGFRFLSYGDSCLFFNRVK